MIIHLYSNCYNEVKIIPYFLRHYETICDKIIIYDAFSDDGSRELLQAHPKVDLRDFHCFEINENAYMVLNNFMYKESRDQANWVLIPDMDEFLWSKEGLRNTLERYLNSGINMIETVGYEMLSQHYPTTNSQIYDEVNMGIGPISGACKPIIFNPNVEVIFGAGKHRHDVQSNCPIVRVAEILLLHYRNIGRDESLAKHRRKRARLSEDNIRNKWGDYVNIPDNEFLDEFDRIVNTSDKMVIVNYD